MKFSIITVCLNAGDDLKKTVGSACRQTCNDFEIVIKDGLSTDGSLAHLPVDNRIRLIQKNDIGIYDAMNQAIEMAHGDYCIFINAGDTLYDDTTLEQISSFIEEHSGNFYYGKSYTLSSGIFNYGPEKVNEFFCYRTTMCHQAMVIETSYLKQRGYDIKYKISADREWMVYAFMKAKMKFLRMPITVSNYKGDGISYGDKVATLIQEENKRIIQTYFPGKEGVKYAVMYALTFPRLRRGIRGNPKLKKTYYNIRFHILNRGMKE